MADHRSSVRGMQQLWACLSHAQGLHLSYDWLLSQEGRFVTDHCYSLVWHGGVPKLGVGSFLLRGDERHVTYRLSEAIAGGSALPAVTEENGRTEELRILHDARPVLCDLSPTLVCVSPSSYVPCIVGSEASLSDPALLTSAVDELLRARERWSAASVAVFHVDTVAQPALAGTLRACGFKPVLLTADTTMDLTAIGTLEAYFSALGPARRRSCRKELAKFRAAGCTVRVESAHALNSELAEIQVRAHRKYGFDSPTAMATVLDRFERTRSAYPAITVLVARGADGAALGFVAVLVSGKEAVPILGAFLENPVFAYFVTAFYSLIDYILCETSAEIIRYGATAYEAKLARGCTLHPLWTFVLGTPWSSPTQLLAMEARTRLQTRAFDAYGPGGLGQ